MFAARTIPHLCITIPAVLAGRLAAGYRMPIIMRNRQSGLPDRFRTGTVVAEIYRLLANATTGQTRAVHANTTRRTKSGAHNKAICNGRYYRLRNWHWCQELLAVAIV